MYYQQLAGPWRWRDVRWYQRSGIQECGSAAKQEKASELNLEDDTAPYNVALCLVRLGFYCDGASWYEEVLRRNPNHKEKQDIVNRIQVLRR